MEFIPLLSPVFYAGRKDCVYLDKTLTHPCLDLSVKEVDACQVAGYGFML